MYIYCILLAFSTPHMYSTLKLGERETRIHYRVGVWDLKFYSNNGEGQKLWRGRWGIGGKGQGGLGEGFTYVVHSHALLRVHTKCKTAILYREL